MLCECCNCVNSVNYMRQILFRNPILLYSYSSFTEYTYRVLAQVFTGRHLIQVNTLRFIQTGFYCVGSLRIDSNHTTTVTKSVRWWDRYRVQKRLGITGGILLVCKRFVQTKHGTTNRMTQCRKAQVARARWMKAAKYQASCHYTEKHMSSRKTSND